MLCVENVCVYGHHQNSSINFIVVGTIVLGTSLCKSENYPPTHVSANTMDTS